MLKFIHTADLHLGAKYSSLDDKASIRSDEHLKVWQLIVDTAIYRNVDVVLLAGDVFDSNHVASSVVDIFVEGLSKLKSANIETVIVPGTHDPYLRGKGKLSDPRIFTKAHILWNKGSVIPLFSKDGGNVYFYGLGFDGYTDIKTTLKSLCRKDQDGIHVGSLHCSLIANPDWRYRAVDFPVDMEDLASLNLDYVALGHYHDKKLIEKNGKIIAAYPGSPDGVKFSETGDRFMFYVEIDSAGKVKIEELKSNILLFSMEEISVSSAEELNKYLEENKNPFSATQLTIKGFVPNMGKLDDKGYFFLKVIDQTLPFDLKELQQELATEKTIRGEFITALLKDVNDNNRELYLDVAKEVLLRLGDI